MLGTPSPERKLAGKTSRQEYSLAPASPRSIRPLAGASVPSMGEIELAVRSQPEEVTTTEVERNAEP